MPLIELSAEEIEEILAHIDDSRHGSVHETELVRRLENAVEPEALSRIGDVLHIGDLMIRLTSKLRDGEWEGFVVDRDAKTARLIDAPKLVQVGDPVRVRLVPISASVEPIRSPSHG
jgi:predicted LPLAT superfamily acyltransferase